ncbi:MAG TPA: DNA adenine methylase [Planctomycetaceae bacterium]|jgi:DNA adenine methylase
MTDSEMKITALAPWFGGKRTLASKIIEELGPHRAYWEPFCGGMSILLAKPPTSSETVNDLHGDLINLARCLQDSAVGPSLYRRLRRAMNSQELFNESRARCNNTYAASDHLDADRAYDYFLTSWQGMNGVAGTARYNLGFARRLTKNGGHGAKRFQSIVESIPAFRRRLRAVTILSCDGIELCEKIEDATGVVIYLDPPYIVKGASYQHDFTNQDHARLAAAVCRFRHTRVVVSYYDHPSLADLYPGWTVRPVHMTKSLVSQGRRGVANDTVAPEVLLINGASFAIPSSFWST